MWWMKWSACGVCYLANSPKNFSVVAVEFSPHCKPSNQLQLMWVLMWVWLYQETISGSFVYDGIKSAVGKFHRNGIHRFDCQTKISRQIPSCECSMRAHAFESRYVFVSFAHLVDYNRTDVDISDIFETVIEHFLAQLCALTSEKRFLSWWVMDSLLLPHPTWRICASVLMCFLTKWLMPL